MDDEGSAQLPARLLESRRQARLALQHVGTEFLRTTGQVLPMRVLVRNGGAVVAYDDADWFVNPPLGTDEPDDVLVFVADAVQEALIERYQAIWPVCVVHDRPLWARESDGEPAWTCDGAGGHVVARIGELAAGDSTFSPGSFPEAPDS